MKNEKELTRRDFTAAASATLAVISLGAASGCGGDVVLELIRLLKTEFSLDDGEDVSGSVVLSNNSSDARRVKVVFVLKHEDGTIETTAEALIRVPVTDEHVERWSGLKPVRRGQHSVEATAQGDTVTSPPCQVT